MDQKLLIAVCTCAHQHYADKRDACRETWVPAACTIPGVQVALFDGGPPGRQDVVGLNCLDTWEGLPIKIAMLMIYVAAWYPDTWVFKCDDDTFVDPDRLVAFFKNFKGDYAGYVVKCDGFSYASGGAGYLMSPRAVRIAAATLQKVGEFEDKEMGRTLSWSHIHPEHSELFRPDRNPMMPADRITEHQVSAAGMRELWAAR